jgi:hypothetical protein
LAGIQRAAKGRMARYGAYYLVARNFSGLSETGTAFSRWLLGQFAIDTEAVFRAR